MYNTIIIGAGPAGMAAALYLKRSGINTLLIDKDAPGGNMLKTDKIENYLGFENISGADLAFNMYNQIKNLGVKLIFGEVIKIEKAKNFIVKTKEESFECKNIIIATGKANNKLNIGEDGIKGIHYCAVCDGSFYKDKIVAVIGGGASAFTESIYLSDIAKKVYLINRSSTIKADKYLQDKVKKAKNITYLESSKITKINSENGILKNIVINDEKTITTDGLFIAIGGKPKIDFIDGLETEKGYLIVNEKMQTNIKGIYGAGDVCKKDYDQIITAVSDGVIAALTIKGGR